jgi:DNA adenine methylase
MKPVRPVLKWAGGKRQLLPVLRPYYPSSFARYLEPFVGSGAVFLDLYNRGMLDGRDVQLSDNNVDVIGCYRMIRDHVDDVIEELRALQDGYRSRGREHFYEVRDDRFNPRRRAIHDSALPDERYTPDVAAMLIYLNRTGYNGLFRVNRRGLFNVPAGRHTSPRICDADNLRQLSAALARPRTALAVRDFDRALGDAGAGDFVYLDPPYAPVSRTAHFTSYTSERFGHHDQAQLQRTVIRLAERGVHVLLSNSFAPDISALYAENSAARGAGLRARTVQARRAINSRASARGAVLEYLITNIPAAAVVN